MITEGSIIKNVGNAQKHLVLTGLTPPDTTITIENIARILLSLVITPPAR
jgi:hypothetical protein